MSQLSSYKTRARSAVDSSNDRRLRDEAVINVNLLDLLLEIFQRCFLTELERRAWQSEECFG